MSLAKQGFTTITGGGPSMMEAVNRGAIEAKGESWGICVSKEGEKPNGFFTHSEVYDDFPTRHKKLLSLGEAFIALPGGLGTLHEVLEITQYKKFKILNPKTPLVLYTDFFKNIMSFADQLYENGFLHTEVSNIFTIAHEIEDVLQQIR